MKARGIIVDTTGIVMGILVLLAGLLALGGLEHGLIGGIALFVSVCLFIPRRAYGHRTAGAIGFAALILAAAVSVSWLGFFGLMTYHFLSDLPAWQSFWLISVWALASLIGFVLAHLAAGVLLAKLRPRLVHGLIGIAIGIAVGLLYALLVYLPYFQH